MAGGYPSRGGLGIPIGQRGTDTAPGPADDDATVGRSVPPRRLPFVFAGQDSAPGLVVEQRRTEAGWQVLVAVVECGADGGRSLSVRWYDPANLTPAGAARVPPHDSAG